MKVSNFRSPEDPRKTILSGNADRQVTSFRRSRNPKRPSYDARTPYSDVAGARHMQVQWLLARVGRKFGCRIWIAANDHNERWNGERPGDLGLRALPSLGIGNERSATSND
jgi:hypothetical protein